MVTNFVTKMDNAEDETRQQTRLPFQIQIFTFRRPSFSDYCWPTTAHLEHERSPAAIIRQRAVARNLGINAGASTSLPPPRGGNLNHPSMRHTVFQLPFSVPQREFATFFFFSHQGGDSGVVMMIAFSAKTERRAYNERHVYPTSCVYCCVASMLMCCLLLLSRSGDGYYSGTHKDTYKTLD